MRQSENDFTVAHYVSNEDFLKALVAHRKACRKAKRLKQEEPVLPDYLGEIFLLMATRISRRANFFGYSYRDDMLMDGVENCIRYCSNFDPKKSKNPFGYFSQILFYAMRRRIIREKKQTYIKFRLAVRGNIDQTLATFAKEDSDHHHLPDPALLDYANVQEFIRNYEESMQRKKSPKKIKKSPKKIKVKVKPKAVIDLDDEQTEWFDEPTVGPVEKPYSDDLIADASGFYTDDDGEDILK